MVLHIFGTHNDTVNRVVRIHLHDFLIGGAEEIASATFQVPSSSDQLADMNIISTHCRNISLVLNVYAIFNACNSIPAAAWFHSDKKEKIV
ncbi:hypothetical protein UB51_09410 [Paenibacillus sp. IHBB 10380]|nr:hypothetical protein UB51_09410 [Paenibacillus sp. IHBB 10380]